MAKRSIKEFPKAESLEKWYENMPECCRGCTAPSVNYFSFCGGIGVALTCGQWDKCADRKECAKE